MSTRSEAVAGSLGGQGALRYWLGLGGNVGDVEASMAGVLDELDARDGCKVLAVSGLYSTPPWGDTDQPAFLNACAVVSSSLQPIELLDAVKDLERFHKRQKTRRWGPRTIDVDLLVHEEGPFASERLQLPHPRMTGRGFVLMPLADIAPDLVVEGRTVCEWLAIADVSGIEQMRPPGDWWPTKEYGGQELP